MPYAFGDDAPPWEKVRTWVQGGTGLLSTDEGYLTALPASFHGLSFAPHRVRFLKWAGSGCP